MEPHKKGDMTEAAVITELKRRDIPVSIPFGDNERYDMLIEASDGRIFRAQIKTGTSADGTVTFRGYSQHTNSEGNTYKTYEGDVDCFLVYTHEHDRLFLVRESEVGMQMTIRLEQPKQEHETINWATDFDFDERWPPEPPEQPRTDASNHSARSESVSELEEHRIPYVSPPDASNELLAVGPDGTCVRMGVRLGTVQNGRVRFSADTEASNIDAYCVYVHELDSLYLIPDDAFDRSISLRVEAPTQADASINWAAEYRFDERWPL